MPTGDQASAVTIRSPLPDRVAWGRAQRDIAALADHADIDDTGRRDPVEILTEQDRDRVPDLVPIRHGRMTATPFTFYRGAAAVMANDLAATPTANIRVQLCGDAHLSNFGLFFGPERHLLFDLNDFDETAQGSFEWDVKRLAASVTIAGRNNGHGANDNRKSTRAAVRAYREAVAMTAELSPIDLAHLRIEINDEILETLDARATKAVDKAGRKDQSRAVEKLTEWTADGLRIVADPPRATRIDQFLGQVPTDVLADFFRGYQESLPPNRRQLVSRYRVADVAHRVVGVGSVGTRCLVVLLESGGGHAALLQFKEATTSVLEPFAGASEFTNSGQRVVVGQQLLQAASDILLGWSTYEREDASRVDFYFRQLWDGKGSADVEDLGPKRLRRYAHMCGTALGLAHARTGDPAAITGYLGDDDTFDRAVAEFADRYADLNEADHGRHRAAIASGSIDAVFDR